MLCQAGTRTPRGRRWLSGGLMPGGCVGQSVAESNAAMEEKLWLVRAAQRSSHPLAPGPPGLAAAAGDRWWRGALSVGARAAGSTEHAGGPVLPAVSDSSAAAPTPSAPPPLRPAACGGGGGAEERAVTHRAGTTTSCWRGCCLGSAPTSTPTPPAPSSGTAGGRTRWLDHGAPQLPA
jgi:hypothetical protein